MTGKTTGIQTATALSRQPSNGLYIFREAANPDPPPFPPPPIQQKSPILAYCSTINVLSPAAVAMLQN